VAYAISESAVGKDFYGKIVRTLGDSAGYKLAKIGEKIGPKHKNYYVFHYDWRQDNVISAGQLADLITDDNIWQQWQGKIPVIYNKTTST
jgi:hypothetical protein